ncbi:MAG TPA: DUF721 domain-containing protein [Waddliaceae bacterium]
MEKISRRTPKGYNGTKTTTHQVKDLLFSVMSHLHKIHETRGDLILSTWPEIVGEKIALFTQAISFSEGYLTVRVKNSTLYSLLTQNDKPKLLLALRAKFPSVTIKDIYFRMG